MTGIVFETKFSTVGKGTLALVFKYPNKTDQDTYESIFPLFSTGYILVLTLAALVVCVELR